MVFWNFVLITLGLIALVKGASLFVKSASSIAKKLGVSEFIIGLTLIALGTSLPELVSSIIASIKHESGLVIGNILGANIANLGLIIGIASIIYFIKTDQQFLKRDVYMMIFSFLLLIIFLLDFTISRIEGGVFILLYLAYTIFLFETKSKRKGKYGFKEFTQYFLRFGYLSFRKKKKPKGITKRNNKKVILKNILILMMSGFFIILGANYFVKEAIFFAEFFAIPKVLIGIIMAFGTTLPELSVAITASRKKLNTLTLGNSIGSCLTNTLLILGTAALIFPLTAPQHITTILMVASIFFGLLIGLFTYTNWKIRKLEGVILLALYILFLIIVF